MMELVLRKASPNIFLLGPVSVLVLRIPPLGQEGMIWINSLLWFFILLLCGWEVLVVVVGSSIRGWWIEAWVPGWRCFKPRCLVACDRQCFFTGRAQEGTRWSRRVLITGRDTHTSSQAAGRKVGHGYVHDKGHQWWGWWWQWWWWW